MKKNSPQYAALYDEFLLTKKRIENLTAVSGIAQSALEPDQPERLPSWFKVSGESVDSGIANSHIDTSNDTGILSPRRDQSNDPIEVQ
ncbi:MAG: hypothetical protein R3A80_02945 [Bdellovibrionota bacterium]